MIETVSVAFSGPAFSFLTYENMKSKYRQEGFLLGDVVERQTQTITDNDQGQVIISRTIRVNCCVPCPKVSYFYDGAGRIQTDKIKDFLGELAPKVVAWYRFRSVPNFILSLRERLVHKQLMHAFQIAPELFTCCLLICDSSENGSTLSFSQNFIRFHSQMYEQLPFHIVNLSDCSKSYKIPEPSSATFNKIVDGLKINYQKSKGLTVVTNIQNALQKHIDQLVDEMVTSEEELFNLENEIANLKVIVNEKYKFDAKNSVEEEDEVKVDVNKGKRKCDTTTTTKSEKDIHEIDAPMTRRREKCKVEETNKDNLSETSTELTNLSKIKTDEKNTAKTNLTKGKRKPNSNSVKANVDNVDSQVTKKTLKRAA